MLEKIPFMEENNPKEFWKLVNSIKSRQSESVSNELTSRISTRNHLKKFSQLSHSMAKTIDRSQNTGVVTV